jgi:hypothetical protein
LLIFLHINIIGVTNFMATIEDKVLQVLENKIIAFSRLCEAKEEASAITKETLYSVYKNGAKSYDLNFRPGKSRAQFAMAAVNEWLSRHPTFLSKGDYHDTSDIGDSWHFDDIKLALAKIDLLGGGLTSDEILES